MFGFEWQGKPLIPTKAVLDEMDHADIDMYKAVEILNEGFDCARSKRKKNAYERCLRRGKKIMKVVAADMGNYYKLIHVGIFSEKKGRFSEYGEGDEKWNMQLLES